MALKVLLADDSAAIKKVVQLSLQDFGVELKSIGSGKDVMDVARSFNPDIAFVDVLLPHKTGYEIATEFKKDDSLKSIPVVMLWSSFMTFDEGKFKDSGAEDRLEKPFEVNGLRNIVNKYVPQTSDNPVSKHLEFPKVPSEEAPQPKAAETNLTDLTPPPTSSSAGQEGPPADSGNWSMSSFQDINTFSAEEGLNDPVSTTQESSETWEGDSEWVRKDIGRFKVDIPDEEGDEEDVQITEEEIQNTDFLLKPKDVTQEVAPVEEVLSPEEPLEEESPQPDVLAEQQLPEPATELPEEVPQAAPQISDEKIEQIVREEVQKVAKELIEQAVWKTVPDIATNLIKDEIQRLLDSEPTK